MALRSATVGDAAAAAVTGLTSGGEASVIDVFAAVMLEGSNCWHGFSV